VADIEEKGKLCLIGELLADRIVGKDVLKSTLRQGWKLMHGYFKLQGYGGKSVCYRVRI
jgi:hypothetical protein